MRRALIVVAGALAACGDDAVRHLPDGPHADIDAAPGIDAWALPPVTVTTLAVSGATSAVGDPIANVRVVALTAAGAIADDELSDASGHATLVHVPTDAFVAAIYPSRSIETIAGVQPGDALQFGERYFAFSGLPGTMTVSWPAVANATSYFVQTRCAGDYAFAPATSIQLQACANTPIVLLSYQNAVNSVPNSAYIAPATYADTATVALPAWTPQQSNLVVSVAGLAAEITNVIFATHVGVPSIYPQDFELSTSATITAGAASVSDLAIPAAVPSAHASAMVELQRTGTTGAQFDFFTGTGASPWNATAPAALPFVDAPVLSATGLDWTQTAGTQHDAITVRVASYTHAGAGYRWQGIFPPTTTHLDLPAILNLPAPGDSTSTTGIVVRAVDFGAADYAAIRAQPFAIATDPRSAVIWGDLPSAWFATTEARPDNW